MINSNLKKNCSSELIDKCENKCNFNSDINNTKKNVRTSRFRRWHSRLHISYPGGVYDQNTFTKNRKTNIFWNIVKSNPIPFLKGQLLG